MLKQLSYRPTLLAYIYHRIYHARKLQNKSIHGIRLNAGDCEISLLPVRVRHVEYTAANNIQRYYVCQKRQCVCFIAIHVCTGKIRFFDLQKFTL